MTMCKHLSPMFAPLAAILLLGSPQAAEGRARDTNPITAAAIRAVHYWHHDPCGGRITIAADAPPPLPEGAPPGVEFSMWATWATPEGSDDEAAPPSSYANCVVHINDDVWSTWLTDDNEFEQFCDAMVHEYGHFEGHGDIGAQPGTVEDEYANQEGPIVAPCRKYRLMIYASGEWLVFHDEPPGNEPAIEI
jgi:hypothetical protein